MIVVNEAKESNEISALYLMIGGLVAFALFGFVLIQMGFLPIGRAQASNAVVSHHLVTQNMQFDQPEIWVQAGEEISLQLRNADLYGHSFDIDALNVHIPMASKDVTLVTFEAPEPGIYTFYCGLPGHTEAGMAGTLIVE